MGAAAGEGRGLGYVVGDARFGVASVFAGGGLGRLRVGWPVAVFFYDVASVFHAVFGRVGRPVGRSHHAVVIQYRVGLRDFVLELPAQDLFIDVSFLWVELIPDVCLDRPISLRKTPVEPLTAQVEIVRVIGRG